MAELEFSQKEYSSIEKALSDSLNRHLACEDRVMDCQKEIRRLEVQIEMLQRKKSHNERGAGRKSRIMQDDIFLTKQCITEGKSLAEIAAILSEKSGKHWSRSTVKYLIDRIRDYFFRYLRAKRPKLYLPIGKGRNRGVPTFADNLTAKGCNRGSRILLGVLFRTLAKYGRYAQLTRIMV